MTVFDPHMLAVLESVQGFGGEIKKTKL